MTEKLERQSRALPPAGEKPLRAGGRPKASAVSPSCIGKIVVREGNADAGAHMPHLYIRHRDARRKGRAEVRGLAHCGQDYPAAAGR
jgi:hypothetical protein